MLKLHRVSVRGRFPVHKSLLVVTGCRVGLAEAGAGVGAGLALPGRGEVAEFAGAVDPVACGGGGDVELRGEFAGDAAPVAFGEQVEVEDSDVAVMLDRGRSARAGLRAAARVEGRCDQLPVFCVLFGSVAVELIAFSR